MLKLFLRTNAGKLLSLLLEHVLPRLQVECKIHFSGFMWRVYFVCFFNCRPMGPVSCSKLTRFNHCWPILNQFYKHPLFWAIVSNLGLFWPFEINWITNIICICIHSSSSLQIYSDICSVFSCIQIFFWNIFRHPNIFGYFECNHFTTFAHQWLRLMVKRLLAIAGQCGDSVVRKPHLFCPVLVVPFLVLFKPIRKKNILFFNYRKYWKNLIYWKSR